MDDKLQIDLHGVKHENVQDIILTAIEEHRGDEILLTIITGHSETMKKLVIDIIRDYGYKYSNLLPTEIKVWIK